MKDFLREAFWFVAFLSFVYLTAWAAHKGWMSA